MHNTPTPRPDSRSPADTGSNQNHEDRSRAHPDAEGASTIPPSDRATDRGHVSRVTPNPIVRSIAGVPGLSLRASSLVTAAVLLRVVGYDQLRRLAYSGLHASAVRKDVREAVAAGWLTRWSLPIPGYGRIGHVHPTARANAAVLRSIRASVASAPWAKVVERMLPSTPRPTLVLTSVPKWFAHQREVNHLVTSIACAGTTPLRWASAWNEPFPVKLDGLTMPQPDYVLVEELEGEASLVFGEHDRGHEPIERFVARKVALYAGLAGACEPTLGVRTFRVDVSVIDVPARQPIARLRQLMDATHAYGAGDLFRFTLGGWLHAYPGEAIWFGQLPDLDSVTWREHQALRR